MAKAVKFSSQIDEKSLKELKKYTDATGRTLSSVLTEAVDQYLNRAQVRPAFQDAVEAVMNENEELLKRLAK
jgi:hypothetical protein